jgi:hypothetical protein
LSGHGSQCRRCIPSLVACIKVVVEATDNALALLG